MGDDAIETGTWLASAMEGTWEVAAALLDYPALADLLGDRHRIIANDWQAASMSSLAGRLLHRAVDVLDKIELTPGRGARRPRRTPVRRPVPPLRRRVARPGRGPAQRLGKSRP
jgi:hypothetical protein